MPFGFIFDMDFNIAPPTFTIDEPDDLDNRCFLQGGTQHCRGCYFEGSCDSQDSYEYERDW